MLVTVYTDASLWNDTGAWAYWAKSSMGTIRKAGVIPFPPKNSDIAEMYAIAKAVVGAYQEWGENVKVIFINTDSLHCCRAMWPFYKNYPDKEHQQLADRMMQWCDGHGLTIRAKHVKAHTDNTDVRSYLNDWCDQNAKAARRKAENENRNGKQLKKSR